MCRSCCCNEAITGSLCINCTVNANVEHEAWLLEE